MRTLLIDNYDSFTYNLFQVLAEVDGAEPVVVRNDEASWEELAGERFESVVISPGPGRPERERDFGICAEAIRRSEVPLLGVCLGHQGLGWVHGGRVERAPTAMHGRVSAVEHAGAALFEGIPARFEVVRYHSLCLGRPLPDCLEEIAWSDDGVAMAIAHRSRPQWGVQFHPESIATEHGARLLANFRDLAGAAGGSRRTARSGRRGALSNHELNKAPRAREGETYELGVRRLEGRYDSAAAFRALYAESPTAFWLDSSRPGVGARFSFMGDAAGPLAATVAYDVAAEEVTVERGGRSETRGESIFDFLDRESRRLRTATAGAEVELPFDFDCGFVGYLGYELKADCGGALVHRSPHPDAALLFADRLIAFDHERHHVYLLCLGAYGDQERSRAWLEATAARLQALGEVDLPSSPSGPHMNGGNGGTGDREPRLARSRRRYLEEIAACKEKLVEGETYEVCLTNKVLAEVAADPLDLYMELRRTNPAPHASYLRFGELAVLSSSPERFLRIGADRVAEAKPIKGTAPRAAERGEDERLARALREDEKSRAENLMIVDLLRNDLGAVCEIGSVSVPGLMAVESFETVHQLVSTIRGTLREDTSPVECIRACFPPGSMTGAPKLRTMEIIDELEGSARGVYSGAIGYLGLGGGCDFSVTIRTIVLAGGEAEIGTGGAIVLQSNAQNELGEAFLKAEAPLAALGASSPRRDSAVS